jgi:hypothetical protein
VNDAENGHRAEWPRPDGQSSLPKTIFVYNKSKIYHKWKKVFDASSRLDSAFKVDL